MYFQLIFAPDRVKALALQHPEWQANEALTPGKHTLDALS